MSNTVPQVYSWIIQDVVDKMGRKFAELGLDENVLTDIKQVFVLIYKDLGSKDSKHGSSSFCSNCCTA
jgi:hypothetical protein